MGEGHGWLFEPTFNRAIKLRQALDRATPCQGQADPRITSDAGALLLREADHRLGLTADGRHGGRPLQLREADHRLGLTADLAGQLTDPREDASHSIATAQHHASRHGAA